jgi:peptide/nickel transport system permease protein
MIRLLIRKLLLMIIILVILNFVAYHYAIRHPAVFYYPFSTATDPNAPVIESQYPEYVRRLLRGDLGEAGGSTVAEVIREPIRNSLVLLGSALVATVATGLLLGFLSISSRTGRIRPAAALFLAAGSSMPGFVLGAILLSLLVYQLIYAGRGGTTLLPISGYGFDRHIILPVIVLAIQPTFHLAKVTAGLLENELQRDYILVARSKGLVWRRLLGRHAWANVLSPALITMGEAMRLMVGGLVIVEAIFLWPGIGRILLYSLGLRLDAGPPGAFFGNPALIAILVVILGSWLLIADLITSLLAYHFDPRLRVAAEAQAAQPA